MNWLVVIIGFAALITSAFCEADDISIQLTDDRTTLIWKPTDAKSIIVRADDGYQIEVQTLQFDVNGESEDYVTVKSLVDDEESDDALMFTYTVSGKPSYLYNNNEVQADYVGNTSSNNFSIQFTRVGEATTTTTEVITSTTLEPMPTAAPDDDPTLTVYLSGQPAENFNSSQLKSLQDSIAKMGTEYCKVQNCPLNGTITFNNVKVQDLEQCPILWENSYKCVSLTFGLPIVKLNSADNNALWDGYQLNQAHLKIMWDTYANKYIHEVGLEIYDVPNINAINTTRIILICLTIVILVILVLVTRHIMLRINKRRRKLSDTVSIMGQQSNRNSQLSLTPHYLQELPPLFSNDFPLYPGKMNQKNYSDFDNFTDDIEPSTSPSSPKVFNLSSNEPDDKVDADA